LIQNGTEKSLMRCSIRRECRVVSIVPSGNPNICNAASAIKKNPPGKARRVVATSAIEI
jgi:hypothetical protein